MSSSRIGHAGAGIVGEIRFAFASPHILRAVTRNFVECGRREEIAALMDSVAVFRC
jgi:hypothetical protein